MTARAVAASLALGLELLSAPAGASPPDEVPLAETLRRAGEYVVAYEKGFALVVAEEHYVQSRRVQKSGPVHETRVLRSDVVFIRSPGTALPWQLLRDVYEVDGAAIRDRQKRLESLLLGGTPDGLSRARAIADEGARFNLGRGVRNYNVPTLVLTFLHPSVQPRFAFESRRTLTIDGRAFAEIAFSELRSPTLIRQGPGGPDVPASGRVFIDPANGTVARTELSLAVKGDGADSRSTLMTVYRAMPSLGLWVPVEMREIWDSQLSGSRGRSGPLEFVDGTATYGGFRRAEVDTQESLPPEP